MGTLLNRAGQKEKRETNEEQGVKAFVEKACIADDRTSQVSEPRPEELDKQKNRNDKVKQNGWGESMKKDRSLGENYPTELSKISKWKKREQTVVARSIEEQPAMSSYRTSPKSLTTKLGKWRKEDKRKDRRGRIKKKKRREIGRGSCGQ